MSRCSTGCAVVDSTSSEGWRSGCSCAQLYGGIWAEAAADGIAIEAVKIKSHQTIREGMTDEEQACIRANQAHNARVAGVA